ncbi:hypothetical protein ACFLZN_01315 [Nanoarchaeota archaeon]
MIWKKIQERLRMNCKGLNHGINPILWIVLLIIFALILFSIRGYNGIVFWILYLTVGVIVWLVVLILSISVVVPETFKFEFWFPLLLSLGLIWLLFPWSSIIGLWAMGIYIVIVMMLKLALFLQDRYLKYKTRKREKPQKNIVGKVKKKVRKRKSIKKKVVKSKVKKRRKKNAKRRR